MGGRKVKKPLITLTILLAAAIMIATFSSPAAAITGQCSNCHTMHNSQDGSPVVQTYNGSGGLAENVADPVGQLLNATCIACHTGGATETGALNSFGAPIVLHIGGPTGQGRTYTLAGGDFYWVADGLGNDDAKGHNVSGISSQDEAIYANLDYSPPGWDPGATPGANNDGQVAGGETTWTSQLTCAGKYGCHGNHAEADPYHAIQKAHHSNDDLSSTQATDATTIGNSFRFLSGIKGLENSDWNWNENNADHNEYYGTDGNSGYINKDTINYSCAQCHGVFHKTIGSSSPWVRHPTDIALPGTGEYGDYNPDDGGLYSVEAPVARPAIPSSSRSTVVEGDSATEDGAIVMCLSCHRAHGSPEPDILRWTYGGMQAGTGTSDTGCFTCHTTKNAD